MSQRENEPRDPAPSAAGSAGSSDVDYQRDLDELFEIPPPLTDDEIDQLLAQRLGQRGRRRRVVALACLALLVVGLVAIGGAARHYRWGLQNSQVTLPFERAGQVLLEEAHYSFENVRVAQNRLSVCLRNALRGIVARRQDPRFEQLFRDVERVIAAGGGPRQRAGEAGIDPGLPFDQLLERLGSAELQIEWDSDDSERVLHCFEAGVGLIQHSRSLHPRHEGYGARALRRLDALLKPPEAPSGDKSKEQ